jgi:hypothetical protein
MEGPGVDFLANPRGDMALAQKYLKEAATRRARSRGPRSS